MTEAARRGWWWWPLAVGGVLIFLLGVVVGRITDSSGADTRPRTAAAVIEDGGPLGPIEGAGHFSADRHDFAWPGQLLTAPAPTDGRAVAWQWETCDVPAEGGDQTALVCSPVQGATRRTWESPPVDRTRLVQVKVTVDLGDGIRVAARSRAVAAVPWPANVIPGDPPPTTAPPPPVPPDLPLPAEPPPPLP